MIRKVALFDFDNTLANGDTIERLIITDLKKHPLHIYHMIPLVFTFIGYKLHLNSFETCKQWLIYPLKYMDDNKCEKFYNEHVKQYYYPNVVSELKELKDKGYYIVICTASSEIYMKYTDLPCDLLIGTLTNKNKIIGKNCKGKEKIPRILDALKEKDIEIDYEESVGYSDSNSDIPMLSLVKNRYRVELKTGKIKEFK